MSDTGMKQFRLPLDEGTLEFTGEFADSVDNDGQGRLRWVELRAYRYLDTDPAHDASLPAENPDRGMHGKTGWLLYTVGRSVVYHDPAGSCRRGAVMPASRFPEGGDIPDDWHAEHPDDLEPCPECTPGDWRGAAEGAKFSVEMPLYSRTKCQTAAKLVQALHRPPRCSGCVRSCRRYPHNERHCDCGCRVYSAEQPALSGPGRRLLEQLAQDHEEIAQLLKGRKETL